MLAHSALAALSFVALVHGGPLVGRNPQYCNTGQIQCCQSVQSANSPGVTALLTDLSILDDLVPALSDSQVGFGCTLLGAGSAAKCTASPVCCNQTKYDGVINVGCTSMNVI